MSRKKGDFWGGVLRWILGFGTKPRFGWSRGAFLGVVLGFGTDCWIGRSRGASKQSAPSLCGGFDRLNHHPDQSQISNPFCEILLRKISATLEQSSKVQFSIFRFHLSVYTVVSTGSTTTPTKPKLAIRSARFCYAKSRPLWSFAPKCRFPLFF